MSGLHWITHQHPPDAFPDVGNALQDPDGLLAIGGDLSVERLLCAYERGIFPWYSLGQPVLWWSPNPRAVLYLDEFRISRSLRKSLRNAAWRYSLDEAFSEVMHACASTPRPEQDGTWISDDMIAAYETLHAAGHAHSVEVWQHDQLVGGLYGVSIGSMFFGESMFSHETDASKAAMTLLVKQLEHWNFAAIDCQISNEHLVSLGSRSIPRAEFLGMLREHAEPRRPGRWILDVSVSDLDRYQPGTRHEQE